jgi:DNA-binding PadR family transcriptional regulator
MARRAGLLPLELAILRIAAAEPEIHGFGVARALRDAHGTGLTAHGTLYKALSRLAGRGLLAARWEPAGDAERAGRPRRRLYRITDAGRAELTAAAGADRPATGRRRGVPRTVTP